VARGDRSPQRQTETSHETGPLASEVTGPSALRGQPQSAGLEHPAGDSGLKSPNFHSF
jgi:hypothetical protein